MLSAEVQVPIQEGPLAVWKDHLRAGRFMLQRCESCAKSIFYPRALCPFCGHERLAWEASEGKGEIYSVTVVARKEKDGGPYNVVLVDLEEGVRMMSRVDGVAPGDVRIGLKVRHAIGEIDGEPVVLFKPAA